MLLVFDDVIAWWALLLHRLAYWWCSHAGQSAFLLSLLSQAAGCLGGAPVDTVAKIASAAGPDSLGLSSRAAPPASRDAVASVPYKSTTHACQGLLDFGRLRLGLWS